MRSWKLWGAAVTAGSIGALGCTSAKSTYLHRNEDGTGWKKEHLKGIPITLEVPTHVKMTIVKRYHYVAAATAPATGGLLTVPADSKNLLVTYDIKVDYIKEKKIFGVDFKRPAAGTFKLGAAISGEGNFTNINEDINDVTIDSIGKQVNDLVKNVLPVLGGRKTTGGETGTPPAVPIHTIESVVASTVVRIDNPGFEHEIREFLCCAAPALGMIPCCGPGGPACAAAGAAAGDHALTLPPTEFLGPAAPHVTPAPGAGPAPQPALIPGVSYAAPK